MTHYLFLHLFSSLSHLWFMTWQSPPSTILFHSITFYAVLRYTISSNVKMILYHIMLHDKTNHLSALAVRLHLLSILSFSPSPLHFHAFLILFLTHSFLFYFFPSLPPPSSSTFSLSLSPPYLPFPLPFLFPTSRATFLHSPISRWSTPALPVKYGLRTSLSAEHPWLHCSGFRKGLTRVISHL